MAFCCEVYHTHANNQKQLPSLPTLMHDDSSYLTSPLNVLSLMPHYRMPDNALLLILLPRVIINSFFLSHVIVDYSHAYYKSCLVYTTTSLGQPDLNTGDIPFLGVCRNYHLFSFLRLVFFFFLSLSLIINIRRPRPGNSEKLNK